MAGEFQKMDPKVKRRWVRALRSGKYTQIEEALRGERSNHHCCLGVYCGIVDPHGWAMIDGNQYHNGERRIPTDLIASIGKLSFDAIDELWRRNDGDERDKHSFGQIATWIQKNL